jgi:hypothetical protein
MKNFKKYIEYYFPSTNESHSDNDSNSYFIFMICFIRYDYNVLLIDTKNYAIIERDKPSDPTERAEIRYISKNIEVIYK